MALFFRNNYPHTIWIAFLFKDTACGGTPFRKMGWWQVNPGDVFNAWDVDLRTVNRFASFYAEEFKDSGGATWSGGGNSWYLISDGAFDQCYDDNSNCNQQPDFVQLDFAGFPDMTVTLGREAGQLDIRGSFPLPAALDFDWNPIAFDNGVPVGGWSHLTIRQDGTYTFTGHFHDSGATEYNMTEAWAVKDSADKAYTFAHAGHVSGTFESGSRDDDWSVDGQNNAISQNWDKIVAANFGTAQAAANLDLVNLTNSLIGTLGTVLGIVAIVVA